MRVGRVSTAAVAVVAAAAFCSVATAEVAQRDGVRVSVAGSMSPTALPRHGDAPIAIAVAGHIKAAAKGALPKLAKIAIAINSHGRLDLRGLPLCRLGHISPSTDAEALAACRDALIGEGRFEADVKIPEQSPFPSSGKVLAFNGKLNGKPAIFAHIYGTRPVPTSYVLPFAIARARGTYGTVLSATLPRVTGEWGYVKAISLDIDRTYRVHGTTHSYISAGCPAPAGFGGAVFPLARTTFSFDGDLALTTTLNRSCRVKR